MARLPRSFWDPLVVVFAAAVTARWICGHWWLDLTPGSLILIACVAALLPVFASTLAMQLLRRGANTDIREAGQLFALRMAWLGPLTIWLTHGSVLAAPCAALFTMLLAAAAWRYYGAVDPRWTIASTHYSLSLAMWASLFIQAAVFTGVAGWLSTACVLAALAAICITARRFQASDPWAAPKPRWFNAFASVLAAFICAAFGLLHNLEFGAGGSANAGGRTRQTTAKRYDDDKSPSIGGDYRGVILWPEETKHTTLIPPLPQLHPPSASARIIRCRSHSTEPTGSSKPLTAVRRPAPTKPKARCSTAASEARTTTRFSSRHIKISDRPSTSPAARPSPSRCATRTGIRSPLISNST